MAKDHSESKDPREKAGLLDAIPKHNLERLLDERGLLPPDLAELLGWGRRSADPVRQWIKGKTRMTNDSIIRVSYVLDVSPLYLLDISPSRFTHEFEGSWYALGGTAPKEKRRRISSDIEEALRASDEDLLRHIFRNHKRDFYFHGNSVHFLVSRKNEQKTNSGAEIRERFIQEIRNIEGDYRDLTQLGIDALGFYLSLCDEDNEAEVFEVVSAIPSRLILRAPSMD